MGVIDIETLQNIHALLTDAAAHPGSRENLIAIIEIARDQIEDATTEIVPCQ